MTPDTVLDHDSIQQPVIEWALDYGITPAIIIARLERGMSLEDAITTPMMTGHKGQRLPIYSEEQRIKRQPKKAEQPKQPKKSRAAIYTVNGIAKTLKQWAEGLNLTASTLQQRMASGMPVEEALTTPNKTRMLWNNAIHRNARRDGATTPPGVSVVLPADLGTGAWSTLQETPNITFSGIDA